MPKRRQVQAGRGPKWDRVKRIAGNVAKGAALAGTAYLGYKGYQKYKQGKQLAEDLSALPGDVVHTVKKGVEPAVDNYSVPHEEAYAAAMKKEEEQLAKDWGFDAGPDDSMFGWGPRRHRQRARGRQRGRGAWERHRQGVRM